MRGSSGSVSRYLTHAPALVIVTVTMLLPLLVLIVYGAAGFGFQFGGIGLTRGNDLHRERQPPRRIPGSDRPGTG